MILIRLTRGDIFGEEQFLKIRFMRRFVDEQIQGGKGRRDKETKGFRLRAARMIKVKVISFNEQNARDKDASDHPR